MLDELPGVVVGDVGSGVVGRAPVADKQNIIQKTIG